MDSRIDIRHFGNTLIRVLIPTKYEPMDVFQIDLN